MEEEMKDDKVFNRWERIYDKLIYELKNNLVYVLVLVMGFSLYREEVNKNKIMTDSNNRLILDRDEWKDIAQKAVNRNNKLIDILTIRYENQNTDSVNSDTGIYRGK